MMNCQDVNSLGASNLINDTIVAVDNFSNLVCLLISGTIRPILGLVSRNEVTFISLSIVREAYFIESWEIYSAMDFKSVSDL